MKKTSKCKVPSLKHAGPKRGREATSSRSHCIFSLELIHKMWNSGARTHLRSKLNVVDLAGSERSKKSQTSGSRLKEGAPRQEFGGFSMVFLLF